MRQRGNSSPSPDASRSLRPGQLLRWVLVFVILAAIAEVIVFSGVTPAERMPVAARPTTSAEATTFNKLQIDLPRNKEEAAAFEKLHHSPYNFEQVKALNSAYSGGNTLTPAVSTTPAVPGSLTPAATSTGQANMTPTPTSSGADKSLRSNGSTACTGVDPGVNLPDACENDDTPSSPSSGPPSSAAIIIVNDVAQIHNLIPNPPMLRPDQDWLVFTAQAFVPYTIVLTPQATATVIPSLALLSADASTIISTGVASGSDLVIVNFATTTTDKYYIRVLAPTVVSTGTDSRYNIRVTSGIALPTPTGTTTVTSTGGPTNTPTPCRDEFEDDNSPGNAKLLKPGYSDQPPFGGTPTAPAISVDNAATQSHFICPEGDIDWVYMDLVKGKAYSVFTSGLINGLDTFIVLYLKDNAGNLVPLYSSDDYPGMGVGSRIDWIVPTTPDTPLGQFVRYYLAIKDVAGHGGLNLKYFLNLTTAGNGLGDCFDQYEPDNNPLQAKEILINETQSHSFCPTGDRDWIRFYAKAGRVYNLSTSNPNAGAAVTGLDTAISVYQVTFDPQDAGKIIDQKLIGQNDDRSDADLTSSVNFTIPSDGYYFAEVKNAGDIGRNGLYYTVRFTTSANAPVDAPATQTAAAGSNVTAIARQTATAGAAATQTAGGTPGTPTSTATATGTPTTTPTRTAAPASLETLLAKLRFGDPGFQKLWTYSDLVLAVGRTQRSWEWGPAPAASKQEAYAEASGGTRQVQYFDKARMEINNPKLDRNSKWFVTNGLLVKELVTGWQATGDTKAELHEAAAIVVAGDLAESNKAPNYAVFQKLITLEGANRAENRVGQTIVASLFKNGVISNLKAPPEQVKLETYITETGHNIPAVFWSYLNNQGMVYDGSDYKQGPIRDWVFSMGLPLSEPYWIRAQVGGVEKDVLVQLFERRVLTYTPSNPGDWRVEMANVGQHYYLWRYNARLENAN